MTTDHQPIAKQAVASRTADASLRLAEARAQIEELIEVNQRLRQELGEMTLMWVAAELSTDRRSDAMARTIDRIKRQDCRDD
ncbi:MAG: hypothetical protein ACJ8GK_10235 [Luteimonas sp.]